MTDQKQLPSVLPSGGLLSIQTFEDLERMAKLYVSAGMYEPSKSEKEAGMTETKKLAIACVKIQAGVEFGLTPHQAMGGLHVINGKVTPGYQTLLALARRHGYNYKVLSNTNDKAEIEWLGRDGKSLGTSKFDTSDMQQARLGGDTWMKWKRRMLFSKAVSEGINSYLPDVLGAPAYTPADFNIVEGEAQEVQESPKSASGASTSGAKSPSTTKSEPSAKTAKAKTEPSKKTEPVSSDATPVTEGSSAESASGDADDGTVSPPPEVTDVDIIESPPPGEDAWNRLYALCIQGGLDEEAAQAVMVQALSDKGISVEDGLEGVIAAWTQETVDYIESKIKEAVG